MTTFLPIILFFIAGAGTPGPNNTIAMAAGANYGFRKTIPCIAGVNVGFPLMLILVGLGLGGVLTQWPWLLDVLRPIGVAYLLWLAWRIAAAPTNVEARGQGKPPGFIQMALFQFVNPKAWTLVVAAVSTYTGFWDAFFLEVLALALCALLFSTPCTAAWALLGVGAGRVISTPEHMRIFNLVMAGLLVVSLIPAGIEIWESVQPLVGLTAG
ncbi:LysE family translocator [Nesterenkonia alba]|uniref:LysE family translocator n=1 Tax=Nesterenkonia alba TaxID=515814 RepID=UPI0003B38085|nr:LysE family translocator [Nesterenkonia alba]